MLLTNFTPNACLRTKTEPIECRSILQDQSGLFLDLVFLAWVQAHDGSVQVAVVGMPVRPRLSRPTLCYGSLVRGPGG